MAKRRTQPPRPPVAPPATAEAGAALIRAHAVKLFDRQDGEGANWPLLAASLFRAGFEVLDKLPDDACRKLAGRVHAGAYDRVTEGPKVDPAASKTEPSEGENAPANTGDLKLSGPVGAKGPFSAS